MMVMINQNSFHLILASRSLHLLLSFGISRALVEGAIDAAAATTRLLV
jgi:methylaspartate ammonia-lyase